MNWPQIQVFQFSVRTEWRKIILLYVLALIFIFTAIGVVDIGRGIIGIHVNLDMLNSPAGGLAFPPSAQSLEFFLLMVSGLLAGFTLPLFNLKAASILVVLLSIPPVYMGFELSISGTLIPMEFHLLLLLVLFGTNVLMQYFSEIQRKQALLDMFGRYVPPDVVSELSRHPELVNLDGESKNMTVIFCDLKNFSGISEQLMPKELVSMLNEYFTAVTEVLYKYGATIDKYIGDSVMAFWSAPILQSDHAKRAVQSSFDMQQEIDQLSASLNDRGLPALNMGIGINSGIMNVGNMGSEYRLAYTVIGDAVNLASRLQTLTRVYHIPVIVGEITANSIYDIEFMELDTVQVRGKKILCKIYHPLGTADKLSQQARDALHQHKEAMVHYYNEEFDTASKLFAELIPISPGFEEYYQYMIEQTNQGRNITLVRQGEIS